MRQPAEQPVTRTAIKLPAGQRLAALDQPAIAISPDGKTIVYVAVQNQGRDREGAGASGFSAGNPRMLFEGPYLPTAASFPFYDVSPGGQRFLMLKPVESQTTAPTQINVVLNWFEDLKRKVPAPL